MTLYDEITNSLDDDKVLIEMLELSFDKDGLYRALTKDKKYNEKKDYKTHLYNFNHYVRNPNLKRLYKNLLIYFEHDIDKKIELKINEKKKELENNPDKDIIINNIMNHYSKHYLYPLKDFENILKKFKTLDNLYDYITKICGSKMPEVMRKLYNYKLDKIQKDKEEAKQLINASDSQIEELMQIREFIGKLDNAFNGGENVMGFHVNPFHLDPNNNDYIKDDIKFYINAGKDSYKFASLFQKKCEEQNINYMYKVTNAEIKECRRKDRICIWSPYDMADKFISIIREIKQEHPEFDYQDPPILCGRIDNFIGVGQDFNNSSFNHSMSKICKKARKKIFGDKNLNEILNIIKKDPSKLNDLRNEIKRKAKEQGLDENKMCVGNDAKDKLPKFLKTDNNINYIQIENNLYIDRKTLELARNKNIEVLGTPRIIINRNYYQITKEQLIELNNSLNKTNTNTNNNKPTKKDFIVVFTDKLTNKKYVKESDLGYKKTNPITILKNTCYEVTDEEIKKLNKKIVTITITIKRKVKTTNNNQSNDFIPGTNIPRPRNRGLYETDEEYVNFLRDYYNKVFGKQDELNKMLNNQNKENDSIKKNK